MFLDSFFLLHHLSVLRWCVFFFSHSVSCFSSPEYMNFYRYYSISIRIHSYFFIIFQFFLSLYRVRKSIFRFFFILYVIRSFVFVRIRFHYYYIFVCLFVDETTKTLWAHSVEHITSNIDQKPSPIHHRVWCLANLLYNCNVRQPMRLALPNG